MACAKIDMSLPVDDEVHIKVRFGGRSGTPPTLRCVKLTPPPNDVACKKMPLPTANPLNTLGFLLVLVLAFFPNLFIGLLKLPFTPLFSTPSIPSLPSCACCPPAHCFPTPTAIETPPIAHPTSEATTQPPPPATMSWFQKTIHLPPNSKGSYLVTDHIERELPELRDYKVGLLNLFVQHTSCALSLNENWDEDVRDDMTDALDRIAPEDRKGNLYRHSAEGLDDMPVSDYGWDKMKMEKEC